MDSTNPAANTQNLPQFNTDEILWYDNGIWGDAGYAIANPMGKTKTSNAIIFNFHQTVGKTLFKLMHQREAVGFTRPPVKQFLYDIYQMCVVGRKRLADQVKMPNDNNGLTVTHAQPAAQQFLVYPVPFFLADRVRNSDIRYYCELGLLMLSEIMQHEDNDIVGYIRDDFASSIGAYLREILAQLGMKFFGFTRAAAYDPAFLIPDAAFAAYDPSKLMLSTELTDERPPDQSWPTTNDLSLIASLPINEALLLCKRWPTQTSLFSGDASVFKADANGGTDANNAAGAQGAAGQPAAAGAFIPPANAAP
jgi:hypothetical protein